jgi:hypothetical protein
MDLHEIENADSTRTNATAELTCIVLYHYEFTLLIKEDIKEHVICKVRNYS